MPNPTKVRLPDRSDLAGGRVMEVMGAAGMSVSQGQEIMVLQIGERTLRFRTPCAGTVTMVLPVLSEPDPGAVLFIVEQWSQAAATSETGAATSATGAPDAAVEKPAGSGLSQRLWQLKWYALGFVGMCVFVLRGP